MRRLGNHARHQQGPESWSSSATGNCAPLGKLATYTSSGEATSVDVDRRNQGSKLFMWCPQLKPGGYGPT